MPARFLASLTALIGLFAVSNAFAAAPPTGGTAFAPAPQSADQHDVAAPTAATRHTVEGADGTDLYVETYLPKQRTGGPQAPAKVPIVIIATPYDTLYQATGYYAALEHLVKRGYGVAINHVRGTGNSGGCLEQTAADQIDDTARVISFLGKDVAYTTGKVGMYGVSYDAETQVSVAGLGRPELIEPLKAIIPIASVGGQYEYSNYDGVPFENQALLSNATYFPISGAPGLGSPIQQSPLGKLECQPELFAAAADDSGDMTPFWLDREYRGGAPNVKAATLYAHGLRDFNVLPQTIRGWFDRLPAATPHKGLFGVWEHAEPDGGSVEPEWQREDWLAMVTAWYDQHLKGADTGTAAWPEVQVQDATGRWRAEPEFPLTGGPASQLALGPDGTLGATRTPTGTTTFEEEGDAVTFTTPKLTAPLSLAGQPVLDLWLKSSKPDGHIAAELEVLGADGAPLEHDSGEAQATYGLRSLRHLDPIRDGWFRQRLGRPAPADTPIRVPVRFLPTDLVVPTGGALRLTLTGMGSQPRGAKASGANSTITVLQDCAHTSTLRFLRATPIAPQLNVREPGEGTAALTSEPRAMGDQDGGGLASGPVCDRAPFAPEDAVAGPAATTTTQQQQADDTGQAPQPGPAGVATTIPSTTGDRGGTALGLPSARRCVSRRRFEIRIRHPHGKKLRSARVTVAGKRVPVRRRGGRLRAVVDLRGKAQGVYRVRIVAKTSKGRTVRATRTYRTCMLRGAA